jgi:hypothetical protein
MTWGRRGGDRTRQRRRVEYVDHDRCGAELGDRIGLFRRTGRADDRMPGGAKQGRQSASDGAARAG